MTRYEKPYSRSSFIQGLATTAFSVSLFLPASWALAGVVASVNGVPITDEDVSRAVANLAQVQRDAQLKDPAAKQQLVQSLIDQELLVQDAQNKKIEETKEFKELIEIARRNAAVSILTQRQFTGKVSEAAAKQHFEKNKIYYTPDRVRAQHILLNTEAEARAVLAEVKKAGIDFQSVAEVRSKDPSVKQNRGDVGFFSRDMFDPAFSQVAFVTEVGKIAGPVKTAFGFHIIKVVERQNAPKAPTYFEVETRVRADLQRKLVQDYVADLRKKAKITR